MAIKKKTRRKITYLILIVVFSICMFAIFDNADKITFTQEQIQYADEIRNNDVHTNVNKSDISIGLVDIDTFNPILTENEDVISFTGLVYDSLFDYSENMSLVNELVDTYNYNDNVLYIKLKKNIYWHNGNKLTSKDVKFTIDMIKQYKGIYYSFVKNISDVEIVDDYTFKITVLDRSELTEYDLVFPIVSSDYYNGEDFEKTDKNFIPIGTGMYRYYEKVSDNEYVFEYNDKKDIKAQVGKIYIYNYSTISEAFAAIKNKKVDMIFTKIINYDEYIGKIGYSKQECIDNTYMFLTVNIANKYLNNIEVRKAINIGLDKENIFAEVYNGLGYVSQSVVYPHSYLYKNIDENYDVDQAKQMLIDEGVNNQVTLNLLVKSDSEDDVKVAELIKEQLKKINVEINVVQKKNKEYIQALNNREYDLALVNFNITNNINMNMFDDNAYYNVFNFENVEFKNYIANIKNLNTYEQRVASFEVMQEMIAKQIPYIGIGFRMSTIIYSSDLMGVTNVRYNNFFMNFSEFNKK